jgi:hypothetical protein
VKAIDTNAVKVITCYREAWSGANKGQAVPSAAAYMRTSTKSVRSPTSNNTGSYLGSVVKRSSVPSAAAQVAKAIANSTALAAASRRAAANQQAEKPAARVGHVVKGSLTSRILAAAASAGKRASLRGGVGRKEGVTSASNKSEVTAKSPPAVANVVGASVTSAVAEVPQANEQGTPASKARHSASKAVDAASPEVTLQSGAVVLDGAEAIATSTSE